MKTIKSLYCRMALLLACLLPAAANAQLVSSNNAGAVTITGYSGTAPANLVIPATIGGLPVVGIGIQAFDSQTNLLNVSIPSSVTNLQIQIFKNCTSLTNIGVDPANSVYTSVNGILFNKSQTVLAEYPAGLGGTYVVPNTVTSLWSGAFVTCRMLTNLTLSANLVGVIDRDVFSASGVQNIVIPNGITTIVDNAFNTCPNLSNVTIPNSVTSIGTQAFIGCASLLNIAIPSGVTTISPYSFQFCTALTNVVIPNSVTSIGNNAFYGCSSLPRVTIPGAIGESAFQYCTSLTNVTLLSGATSIGSYAFQFCTSLSGVTIPNTVSSIGNNAFYGCSSLSSVTVPGTVSVVGVSVFQNCTSLTNVVLLNGITNIGSYAFVNCTGLLSVTIPYSVTTIGNNAFDSCASLRNVTIPGSVGVSAFQYCTSLTNVTLLSGTSSIGSYAFQLCTSLLSVTIPNSVVAIGNHAFYGCANLPNITIPGSVGTLDTAVFQNCTSLTNVMLLNGITNINDNVFNSCTSLTSIIIPASVATIANDPFYGCINLLAVYMNGNAPANGGYVFTGGAAPTVYYQPGATGWTSTYSGQPAVLYAGALTVTINGPSSARWALDGGSFINASGVTLSGLTATNHAITFSQVAGSAAPALTNVTMIVGGTTNITVTYIASSLTAANATYYRNGLNNWQISVANLLTNASASTSLASVGTSTSGIRLTISGGYVKYYNSALVNDQFSYTVTNSAGAIANGIITLNAATSSGTPQGGMSLGMTMGGGQATVTFAGIPGYRYQVLRASVMSGPWTPISTNTASANGLFQFVDTAPLGGSAFYRLMYLGN